ncbi:hypothetical protein CVD28_01425 [Bacillus sp. M6-12]|uniref:hypothetical protein n=1 Tax=Bacillus sp. M6-12 TaxID=2054166 RepID=UPI000C77AB91|nr:hypothetical protein [Bacillus sp. M6-12]PLS19095.1 hypothetical protein CVD28_01425 [Bacillus sp. M6-12]
MKLTSTMVFDFQLIEEQGKKSGVKGREALTGEFYILKNGEIIGGLSVSNYYGEQCVSIETPDANFTIDEWIIFVSEMKERFLLEGSQPIMMNKYPQSFAM